jgi:hypothetical protein
MTGSEQMNYVQRAGLIRDQNDAFRKDLRGGQLMLTRGVMEKTEGAIDDLILAISDFDDFTEDNDPYGEHDFASLTWQGDLIFWKIDYYDLDLMNGSPDPSDVDVTKRVLTVMMAWEY